MYTLRVVFRDICEHCREADVSNETCFIELERSIKDRQVFFPLYLYLEVLQSLGLIRFSNYTKEIILTEKGKGTPTNSVATLYASCLLFLYFLRRIFLFILFGLMFLLFWPVFILVQIPYSVGRKKNSAG